MMRPITVALFVVALAGCTTLESFQSMTATIVTPADSTLPASPATVWQVNGATLRATLSDWCNRAGYRLVWSAHRDGQVVDWPVEVRGAVTADDLPQAATRLLEGFDTASVRPRAIAYTNAVLEVRAE